METEVTIYTVARDTNGYGPRFYNGDPGMSRWHEHPLTANYWFAPQFAEDAKDNLLFIDPGEQGVFVQEVRVTMLLVFD